MTTRSRRKPVDEGPASYWLNSDTLNLPKIRDSQQADPVLFTLYDWVDRGVRLWGQWPSLEISSGVIVRRLINAEMSPKV